MADDAAIREALSSMAAQARGQAEPEPEPVDATNSELHAGVKVEADEPPAPTEEPPYDLEAFAGLALAHKQSHQNIVNALHPDPDPKPDE